MVLTALFTAVMCVVAPISIPLGPIPITFMNFVIFLSLYLLGVRGGTLACFLYLVLGAIGLPVFAGFAGGIGAFAGPTGGYLIGYLPLAVVSGIIIEKFPKKRSICILGMIAGLVVCYFCGTVWFCYSMQMSPAEAILLCVIPFLPGDAIKIALVSVVGPALKKCI